VLGTPGGRTTKGDFVIAQSLVQPAHEPTTRVERALRLLEERGHEIRQISASVYRVPSCSGSEPYDVLYGEREECPCPDFQFGGGRPCKHLIAVGVMHAARRSGVKVRTLPAVVAGDPFAHAAKREGCSRCFACYDRVAYLGGLLVGEDGEEVGVVEAMLCCRCNGETL